MRRVNYEARYEAHYGERYVARFEGHYVAHYQVCFAIWVHMGLLYSNVRGGGNCEAISDGAGVSL
jgi:hypothetical protein